MRENLSRPQSLESQRQLLEEELYRLYGPDYLEMKWVSETLKRLEAQQMGGGFSAQDRADLSRAQQVLDRVQVISKFYNPDQPRDAHGRWTSGGALPNAIRYLEVKAGPQPTGQCAQRVREALKEDGIDIPKTDWQHYAKDYGPTLVRHGFEEVAGAGRGVGYPPDGYAPKAGDIVVIQPTSKNPAGHMAMFSGKTWLSDYRQLGFWPGDAYRNEKPRYVIYRHKA